MPYIWKHFHTLFSPLMIATGSRELLIILPGEAV